MNHNLNFSRFNPLTEQNDVLFEWIDLTIDSGDLVTELKSGDKTYSYYELKQEFFGFQVVTDEDDDVVSFNPIFEFPKSTEVNIKGISVLENNIEAILTSKKDSALFSSFLTNYPAIQSKLPNKLDQNESIAFSGWLHSLERQLNPPQIKQSNGKLVTTKGSSIFYNVEGKHPYEFVYQFFIEDFTSMIWNDFIEIIQIKSTLFRTDKEKIELYLYGTERILQNNYFPKQGEDIMGIFSLNSKITS
jgi:hypothetical protein